MKLIILGLIFLPNLTSAQLRFDLTVPAKGLLATVQGIWPQTTRTYSKKGTFICRKNAAEKTCAITVDRRAINVIGGPAIVNALIKKYPKAKKERRFQGSFLVRSVPRGRAPWGPEVTAYLTLSKVD